MGLGFWSWNFQSMNFNSAALLSTEFQIFKRGKMTNLKVPWAFFQKSIPQTPRIFLEQLIPLYVYAPFCIDLITNRPKSFQNSVTVETGLSDFHKMMLIVTKVFYKKQKTNIVTYQNYKHFSDEVKHLCLMLKIVLFK